ncbi:MAG: hypothetical protein PVH56_16190, partial [Desulfobacterales bacterium]
LLTSIVAIVRSGALPVDLVAASFDGIPISIEPVVARIDRSTAFRYSHSRNIDTTAVSPALVSMTAGKIPVNTTVESI